MPKTLRALVFLSCLNLLNGCLSPYILKTYTAEGYSESTGGTVQVHLGLSGSEGENDFLRFTELDGSTIGEQLKVLLPEGNHLLKVLHAKKLNCGYSPLGGTYGSTSCSYSRGTYDLKIAVRPGRMYEVSLDDTFYQKPVIVETALH